MSERKRLISGMAGVCLACFAGTAVAADANRVADSTESSAATEAVAVAGMAHALARYGEQAKDPVALVAAARVLQAIGGTESEVRPTREGAGAAAQKGRPTFASAADALAAARDLAGGQAPVLALIEDAEKMGSRSPVGGPKRTTDVVQSRSTDVFEVRMKAHEPWRVHLVGDGDAKLWLKVYDNNGNEICRDYDDKRYSATCTGTPVWEGPFKIHIQNTGTVPVAYVLRVS